MWFLRKTLSLLFLFSPFYVLPQGLVIGHNINVTLNSGMVVSINDGNLLLRSDASSTGSILNNTNSSSVNISGTASVERYILRGNSNPFGTGLWHYVSSPVTNQPIDMDFITANDVSQLDGKYDFYLWDEQNTIWRKYGGPTFSDAEFIPGKGYSIIFDSDGSRVFTGTSGTKLNDGDIVITVTKSSGSSYSGFNLLGNPYPSPISNADFVAYNNASIEGTLYFWSQKPDWELSGDNYSYWNILGSVGNGQQTPDDNTAIGQAFMVKALYDEQQVYFINTMRRNGDPVYLKNQIDVPRLWLSIENYGPEYNEILIAFPEDGTEAFDPAYDAHKLHGGGLLLSSKCQADDNYNFAIQGLPPLKDQPMTIKLELWTPSAGAYHIYLKNIDNWDQNNSILLEDKVGGVFTDLQKDGDYPFQVSSSGNHSERFLLHFNSSLPSSSENETSINIYTNGGAIYLLSNTNQPITGNLELYNLIGQLVYKKEINQSGLVIYNPNCISGNYIARFISPGIVVSRKLFIQ